jgi:hypothetical protein
VSSFSSGEEFKARLHVFILRNAHDAASFTVLLQVGLPNNERLNLASRTNPSHVQ